MKKVKTVALLRLTLRLREGAIVVEESEKLTGPTPAGTIDGDEQIPDGIIGHWLELRSTAGETLYRCYATRRLPWNLDNAESRLQKIYALEKYHVTVPDLPEASELVLHEQSLPNPSSDRPVKSERLRLSLREAGCVRLA